MSLVLTCVEIVGWLLKGAGKNNDLCLVRKTVGFGYNKVLKSEEAEQFAWLERTVSSCCVS